MKDIGYRDANVFIDEIPMVYKDIDVVMDDAANQWDSARTPVCGLDASPIIVCGHSPFDVRRL
jgi:hypothetical protein